MYFTLKNILQVSNRQAVHPQEALFIVYADTGTSVRNMEDIFQSKIHRESTSCWSYFIIIMMHGQYSIKKLPLL